MDLPPSGREWRLSIPPGLPGTGGGPFRPCRARSPPGPLSEGAPWAPLGDESSLLPPDERAHQPDFRNVSNEGFSRLFRCELSCPEAGVTMFVRRLPPMRLAPSTRRPPPCRRRAPEVPFVPRHRWNPPVKPVLDGRKLHRPGPPLRRKVHHEGHPYIRNSQHLFPQVFQVKQRLSSLQLVTGEEDSAFILCEGSSPLPRGEPPGENGLPEEFPLPSSVTGM